MVTAGSDNGLVLGELLSTDGESNGKDSGHSNGDTTNEEDEDVVETTTVLVTETGIETEDLSEDENTDGNQSEGTDLSENLLQVTGGVIVLANERSSTTEEGVGAGRDNDTLSLTLLASGTAIEFRSLGNGRRKSIRRTHEKHWSPVFLLWGRDSPVRAA